MADTLHAVLGAADVNFSTSKSSSIVPKAKSKRHCAKNAFLFSRVLGDSSVELLKYGSSQIGSNITYVVFGSNLFFHNGFNQ